MQLDQIEADVVIAFTNDSDCRGFVFPLWECEEDSIELVEKATRMALKFSEECGFGITEWQVHDFRKSE